MINKNKHGGGQGWESYDRQNDIGLFTFYHQQQTKNQVRAHKIKFNSSETNNDSSRKNHTQSQDKFQYDKEAQHQRRFKKKLKTISYTNTGFIGNHDNSSRSRRSEMTPSINPEISQGEQRAEQQDTPKALKLGYYNIGGYDSCHYERQKLFCNMPLKLKKRRVSVKEEVQKMLKYRIVEETVDLREKNKNNYLPKKRQILAKHQKDLILRPIKSQSKENSSQFSPKRISIPDRVISERFCQIKLKRGSPHFSGDHYSKIRNRKDAIKNLKSNRLKLNLKDVHTCLEENKQYEGLQSQNKLQHLNFRNKSKDKHYEIELNDFGKIKDIIKKYFNTQYRTQSRNKILENLQKSEGKF